MLPINPLPQTSYFYFACLLVYIYILELKNKTNKQKETITLLGKVSECPASENLPRRKWTAGAPAPQHSAALA